MTLYDALIAKSESGKKVKFDLVHKTINIGKRTVMDNGKLTAEMIGGEVIDSLGIPVCDYDDLVTLYEEFIHSVPSSENGRKTYLFKPLATDELSMEDIYNGINRDVAHTKLCAAIIIGSLDGWLKWETPGWFRKFPNSNFILYRNYIQ